tara:strand:- start:561 stop:701 length:141 start_codon:yes stop_codon:yes gene_type:complete
LLGEIAQLVEQRIENPRVPGSNPGLATTLKKLTKKIKKLVDELSIS